MSKYTISRTIDIAGPDGNCFYLIGIGRNWLQQLNHRDQQEQFSKEMTSGDYSHALGVFKSWFGESTITNSNVYGDEEGEF